MKKLVFSISLFTSLLMGVVGLKAQCPDITIDAQYDHTPCTYYQTQGWDTAITCTNRELTLKTTPFVTTQHFNGLYTVEEIPYNPPELFTFGTRMPITTDDDFGPSVNITFPFCFFGQRKTIFTLGANGIGTFTEGAALQSCPWSYNAGLPWTNSTSGTPSPLTHMRDAIYGVYEDTYPYNLQVPRGIYYGSSPESDYPCRHICFSWNHVPQFNHTGADSVTHNCTYQIVIYEGTNIIEVHVKDRMPADSWNGKNGIIGIQNATGTTQVSTKNNPQYDPNTGQPLYTNYIEPGSPGFFAPAGYNPFQTAMHEKAFRFTPQGTTQKNVQWWKLYPNGDSLEVGTTATDANAIATDAYYADAEHLYCMVHPTEVTKYMVSIKYIGATGNMYYLCDTVTIGIDTANTMRLECPNNRICYGSTASAMMVYPYESQTLTNISWNAMQIVNGEHVLLPDSRLQKNGPNAKLLPAENPPENKIDTVVIYATVVFSNGCQNNDSVVVYTYPNFEFFREDGICKGESYHFNGETYTQEGDYQVMLQSSAGCDSLEHLHLTVYDISHTTDYVDDCKPYLWPLNGKTYTESNMLDTVMLHNRYGCDSIVQLNFTLHPLTPIIVATPENATMDNLSINLTDASIGDATRLWEISNGVTSTEKTFNFSYPINYDSVLVHLVAISGYGCSNDTSMTIHLLKETFWMPNVFTPGQEPNHLFKPYGVGIETFQMYIYDRRGQLVYIMASPEQAWDGRDMHGVECPQGTYTYVIRYTNVIDPAALITKKGTVTLIR